MKRFDVDNPSWIREESPAMGEWNWQQHPQASLSDWTLMIRVDENKEDIYHVHRFVLAVGPNASEFFHDEFVGRFGDASNIQPSSRRAQSGGKIKVFGSTILRMNSASANVMPNVLNFLYENRFEPTPQTCLPMLQVSDQLRIRKLHTLLTDYVQRTMNVENAPIYLLYANLYKMEKIKMVSLEITAENFSQYSSDRFVDYDLPCLLEIFNHTNFETTSEAISHCIAEYLRKHISEWENGQIYFTDKVFREFVLHLHRHIYPSDAILLLACALYFGEMQLRDRCIDVIVSEFGNTNFEDFGMLSSDQLCSILQDSRLKVKSEDVIFEAICLYLDKRIGAQSICYDLREDMSKEIGDRVFQENLALNVSYTSYKRQWATQILPISQEEVSRIWRMCKFAWLSLENKIKALQRDDIPKEAIALGAIAALVDSQSGRDKFELFRRELSFPDAQMITPRRYQTDDENRFVYSHDFDNNGVIYHLGNYAAMENLHKQNKLRFFGSKSKIPSITRGLSREYEGADRSFLGLSESKDFDKVESLNFSRLTKQRLEESSPSRADIEISHDWMNPARVGLVSVTKSSNAGGDPASIFDREFVKTNATVSQRGSWICIELPVEWSVFPTHYTLKHDNFDGEYLRSWKFEGSKNGWRWALLSEHICDTSLSVSFDSTTWEVQPQPTIYGIVSTLNQSRSSANITLGSTFAVAQRYSNMQQTLSENSKEREQALDCASTKAMSSRSSLFESPRLRNLQSRLNLQGEKQRTLASTPLRKSWGSDKWNAQSNGDTNPLRFSQESDMPSHIRAAAERVRSQAHSNKAIEHSASYRFFRIIQTGVNSSGTHALHLGGFEIYGVVKNNI